MRLTDNDRRWGPFILAPWKDQFSAYFGSGDDDDDEPATYLRVIAFGWAVHVWIPNFLPTCQKFGATLSNMGNGYDFLQIFYGPQTWDSSTTKSWSKHLPWKQWDCVRHSVYAPDGGHFATQEGRDWKGFSDQKEACPKSHFGFEDYDGEMIVATCTITEMEWHRGEGAFKWLKYFYPAKVRRSLDIWFNAEVGAGKGSWKGGTRGHGIEMLPGESSQQAFERYCAKGHNHKGHSTPLRFVGPCKAPTA